MNRDKCSNLACSSGCFVVVVLSVVHHLFSDMWNATDRAGAHTIGIAHCSSFADRLYGYPGAGAGNDTTDPSLDATYAANLRRRKCRAASGGYAEDAVVEMDPGSHLTFDLGYYRALLKHRGLLRSDAALLTDAAARADVESVVGGAEEVYFQVFARSMARLATVQVKTGAEGEIRRNCAVVNGG